MADKVQIGPEDVKRLKERLATERDQLKAEINEELARLKAVENALFNKTKDTFSICEDCSLPINKQRMEVDPAVSRCMECQTLYESTPSAKDVTPSL